MGGRGGPTARTRLPERGLRQDGCEARNRARGRLLRKGARRCQCRQVREEQHRRRELPGCAERLLQRLCSLPVAPAPQLAAGEADRVEPKRRRRRERRSPPAAPRRAMKQHGGAEPVRGGRGVRHRGEDVRDATPRRQQGPNLRQGRVVRPRGTRVGPESALQGSAGPHVVLDAHRQLRAAGASEGEGGALGIHRCRAVRFHVRDLEEHNALWRLGGGSSGPSRLPKEGAKELSPAVQGAGLDRDDATRSDQPARLPEVAAEGRRERLHVAAVTAAAAPPLRSPHLS
mmetsp:Transcript_26635/g.63117  ORF Transcript_26635/g.63117 Transcript_26635/m.63117 type:complete len:287 (-) Transcript_26635:864-1724(-)